MSVDGFYICYPTNSFNIERNTLDSSSGLRIGTNGSSDGVVRNNVFWNWSGQAVNNWANYGTTLLVEGNSFLSVDRVALVVETDGNLDAPNNFFGSLDVDVINAIVLARTDDLNRPDVIVVEPLLTEPSQEAPDVAYPVDTDADGVVNELDGCLLDFNPVQEDIDNDGRGDICDSDNDNDGFTDKEEINFGSDPLDSEDYPVYQGLPPWLLLEALRLQDINP